MKTMLIKMLTKKSLSAVIISASALVAMVGTQAEIYKWKDANGVTHYSAQKPVQKKVKAENIERKIRLAAGKPKASTADEATDGQEAPKTEATNDNAKTKTQLAGPSKQLVTYCKNQRKNLAQLKKNYRNIWKDKDGKTSRLNQQQRQDKVNQIQESITSECAGV